MTLITINLQGGWKWGTYEKTLARVSSPSAKFRCAAKGLDLETMRAYIRGGVDVNEKVARASQRSRRSWRLDTTEYLCAPFSGQGLPEPSTR